MVIDRLHPDSSKKKLTICPHPALSQLRITCVFELNLLGEGNQRDGAYELIAILPK